MKQPTFYLTGEQLQALVAFASRMPWADANPAMQLLQHVAEKQTATVTPAAEPPAPAQSEEPAK